MAITKEQMQAIDTAFEQAIIAVRPIVTSLSAGIGFGTPADCYALKGWGLLMEGAVVIDKAKTLQ